MTETLNATIASTFLGVEDHGMFVPVIRVEWNGGQQALPSYRADTPAGTGCAMGMDFIVQLVSIVGATCWERLPGTLVRIRREHGMIVAIGHILDDRWFCFKAWATSMGFDS